MPIDPDVQKALDEIKGLLAPEALSKLLAPALDAHGKAILEKVPKGIDQKALDEALAKLKQADSDPKAGKGKDGESPELAALRAEIQAEKEARAASERARLETEAKALREANRNKLRAALAAKDVGVTADAIDDAIAAIEARGVLVLDGESPGWKQPNRFNASLVETVPFEEGAKAWAQTPSGKRYIAPIEQRGTGDGPNTRQGGTSTSSRFRNADGSLNLAALGGAALGGAS